jgi:signal peptide peptidase SppA
MKYAHVAKYVIETPWAILQSKLDEIEAILQFHMEGGKFTAEELRARIGDPSQPEQARRGAVAVLPLKGVVSHRMGGMTEMSGGMSTERFSAMFRQALADPAVGSIVIDVDSPGGTIAGVTELAGELFAARGRKPIIAHVNALAASAAYWIASAADEIVSTPSGQVGAIGVITAHVDTSKADESEGVTRTVISAGKYKAEGFGPLTEDAKAAIQARVDEAYAVMTKDIARARGVKASDVRNGFGEGRVVSATQAQALGMIDGIGTLDQVVARLAAGKSMAGMRAEEGAAAQIGEYETSENKDTIAALEADANRARRMRLL